MKIGEIVELFYGIGVVIDDEIGKEFNDKKGDRKRIPIDNIIRDLGRKGFKFVTYRELPNCEDIKHLHSVSFVILDWKLISPGNPMTETRIKENVDFISQLNKVCYVPVFIFSNEDPQKIKDDLKKYGADFSNIFVEAKRNLRGVLITRKIAEWLRSTPSMLVLKLWERALREAKQQVFTAYSTDSPNWPILLVENYEQDSVGMGNFGLAELLLKNLSARIKIPKFKESFAKKRVGVVSSKKIINILEKQSYLEQGSLDERAAAGDVFHFDRHYFVNIRPDCDTACRRATLDAGYNPELYLLKAKPVNVSAKEVKKQYNKGALLESADRIYIPFVKGKILKVQLTDLEIKEYSEIRGNRIGRLIPPYITRIQQKFSTYLMRQGLSRLPETIFETPKKTKE